MNTTLKLPLILGLVSLLQACIITNPISNDGFKATENSAYTADGRLFVIGENNADQSWIFEILKNADGSYTPSPFVKGTQDGTQHGYPHNPTVGADCTFAGLTAKGTKLYAACAKSSGLFGLGAESISLYQVETTAGQVFIKTGRMEDSNFLQQDHEKAFDPNWFFANGMAVDAAGHVYISNSKASLAGNRDAISQVTITDTGSSNFLDFKHKTWLTGHEFFPNGVQIEGNTLYYAAGSDIDKVRIKSDYSAGEVRTHFDGSDLATIDDFAIEQGYIAYSKVSAPGSVVILKPASFTNTAKHLTTVIMPVIPSSIVYQKDIPGQAPLFSAGSLLVTSFFSGGLYQIEF